MSKIKYEAPQRSGPDQRLSKDSTYTVYRRRPTNISNQSSYGGIYIKRQKEKKRLEPWFITRSMATEFGREAVFRSSIREVIILIPFIVTLLAYSSSIFNSKMHEQKQRIYEYIVDTEFTTFGDVTMTFKEIKDMTDIWHFLEGPLLDFLYNELFYDIYDPIKPTEGADTDIGFNIWLLGRPRIRQVQTTDSSCKVPHGSPIEFPNCFALYSESVEAKETYGFGLGTAWIYSTAQQTGHKPTKGYVETYGGGGFYADISRRNRSQATADIYALKYYLWLRRETRAVFVHTAMYNVDVNIGASCLLLFELFPSGMVQASLTLRTFIMFRTLDVSLFAKYSNYIIYFFIAYYVVEQLRDLYHFRMRYFKQMWHYVDLFIIVTSCCLIPYIIGEEKGIEDLFESISEEDMYVDLDDFAANRAFVKDMMGFLIFFSIVKLVKYVNINKKMSQLNKTIENCAGELAGFFLIFTIIIASFADWAVIWFGDANMDYRSFERAVFTTIRILLGFFRIKHVAAEGTTMAPYYYVTFTIVVFFLYLNMFIAIINKSYQDVSTEIAIAPREMQFTDYIQNLIQGCCKTVKSAVDSERTVQRKTVEQLWLLLAKYGYSDITIHLFFTRYNIKQEDREDLYDFEKLKEILERDTGMDNVFNILNKSKESKLNTAAIQEKEEVGEEEKVTATELAGQSDELGRIEQSLDGLVLKVKYFTSKLDLLQKREAT